MTPDEALIELLERVAALQGAPALISAHELEHWPSDTVAVMKAQKLITKARPSSNIVCPGCEEECIMPVQTIPVTSGDPALFVVCDRRDDISRVAVPASRLEQWLASGDSIADMLAELLGLQRSGVSKSSSGRWEIGVLRGKKHSGHLVLLARDKLTLEIAGHSIPLSEVLALKSISFKVDKRRLINLVDHPNPATKDKVSQKKPTATAEGLEIGSAEWRSHTARNAANARHNQPGGSRDKQQQIRDIWATGKYSSRDRCAEEECAALDMSYSAARKALRNTPEPKAPT